MIKVKTNGFSPDVTWVSFVDKQKGIVGFRCLHPDGRERSVYLCPSSEGEGEPDVFLYEGPDGDPMFDTSILFVTPEFGDQS
jgi:hypothetical protein